MLARIEAALAESEDSVVVVSHGHFPGLLTWRCLRLTAQCCALFQLATGTMSWLSTEHRRPLWRAGTSKPTRTVFAGRLP
ncbi:hypothetical protein AB0454_43890 [Streptomyces sp. NPDC093509]|uniref:hypothetical protein n=1 Tax=Streptomyces sp. NPDC093509 TaxID=3154982 RepID=UPI00344FA77B